MKNSFMISSVFLLLCSCGVSSVPDTANDSQDKRISVLTEWAGETLKSSSRDGVLIFSVPKEQPVRAESLGALKIDNATSLKVGQIIASAPTAAAPYGILAEVTSISSGPSSGNSTNANLDVIVKTKPATIEKAFNYANVPSGDYQVQATSSSGEMTPYWDPATINTATTDFLPPTDLNPAQSTAPGGVATESIRAQWSRNLYDKTLCFNKTIIDKRGVPANINGCAKINSSANLNINWGFFKINRVEMYVDGLMTTDGSVSASSSWGLDKQVTLAMYNGPTQVYWVAGIPVVITPSYSINLNVNGTITASANINESASVSGIMGAFYDRSSGWSIRNSVSVSSPTPISINTSIDLSARASIAANAGMYLYGVVGLSASADAYTNVSYTPLAPSGSRGNVIGGIRGSVRADATRFLGNSAYLEKSLFDYTLFNKTF